jgi:hypothetical protein
MPKGAIALLVPEEEESDGVEHTDDQKEAMAEFLKAVASKEVDAALTAYKALKMACEYDEDEADEEEAYLCQNSSPSLNFERRCGLGPKCRPRTSLSMTSLTTSSSRG